MADEVAWPTEEIPDADFVFMRAHKVFFKGDELAPGVFRPQDGGMSADWNKYAKPEDTRNRARKNPLDNAIVELPVGHIRNIGGLTVEHTPETDNRAHCEVFNLPEHSEELTRVRVMLLRISRVVIGIG